MTDASKARIAFQGERGAFSEEAVLKLLGSDIALVPCGTFDATFSAIEDGLADYVLAPMENSLAGSVHRSFDLLVESGLHIVAEVIIPIAHNLIAVPGATFEGLISVASHPVALAQCERFFATYTALKRIPAEDTAGSVRDIMRAGDKKRAAIASSACGRALWRRDSSRTSRRRSRKLHTILSAGARGCCGGRGCRRARASVGARQNLAGVSTGAHSGCLAARARAFRAAQHQHDEN